MNNALQKWNKREPFKEQTTSALPVLMPPEEICIYNREGETGGFILFFSTYFVARSQTKKHTQVTKQQQSIWRMFLVWMRYHPTRFRLRIKIIGKFTSLDAKELSRLVIGGTTRKTKIVSLILVLTNLVQKVMTSFVGVPRCVVVCCLKHKK